MTDETVDADEEGDGTGSAPVMKPNIAFDLLRDAVAALKAGDLFSYEARRDWFDRLSEPETVRVLAERMAVAWKEVLDLLDELVALPQCTTAGRKLRTQVTMQARIVRITTQAPSLTRQTTTVAQMLPADVQSGLTAPQRALAVPRGYRITRDSVVRVTATGGMTTIATGPLLVTARSEDPATGEIRLMLSWHDGIGWKMREDSRDVFTNAAQLSRLARFGLPVTSASAKYLVTYVEMFEAANRSELSTGFSVASLGWWPKDAPIKNGAPNFADFILPDGSFNDAPVVFLPQSAAPVLAGVGRSGDIDGWCKAFAAVDHLPLLYLAVYGAVASILLPIVGCPSFTLSFSEEPGSGKTTALFAMASVWGRPALSGGFIASWDDTMTSLEIQAGVLGNLPIIADETQRMRDRSMMIQVIYNHWGGAGRNRSTADIQVRAQNKWHSVLAASGESSILNLAGDDRLKKGGVAARALEVSGRPTGPESETGRIESKRFTRAIQEHFGHLGPLVVSVLLEDQDRWSYMVEFFDDMQQQVVERYDLRDSATGGRLAAYVAVLILAAEIVHSDAVGMPRPKIPPAEFIVAATLGENTLQDRYLTVMHRLRSWIQDSQSRFWGRHEVGEAGLPKTPYTGWAGRWDSGNDWQIIYIKEPELNAWLHKQGLSPSEYIAGWGQRGWLYGKKPNYLTDASVMDLSVPCYAIPRKVYIGDVLK